MNSSDLEEEDSPDDELLPIAHFSQVRARMRQTLYDGAAIPPLADGAKELLARHLPNETGAFQFPRAALSDPTLTESFGPRNAAPGTRGRAARSTRLRSTGWAEGAA